MISKSAVNSTQVRNSRSVLWSGMLGPEMVVVAQHNLADRKSRIAVGPERPHFIKQVVPTCLNVTEPCSNEVPDDD